MKLTKALAIATALAFIAPPHHLQLQTTSLRTQLNKEVARHPAP